MIKSALAKPNRVTIAPEMAVKIGSFAPQEKNGITLIVAIFSLSSANVLVLIMAGTEQPNPIIRGKNALPLKPNFLKILSRINAIRAIYPLSSIIEKNKNKSKICGKNEKIENIPPKGITVLTESGYLMIVKTFTDDLSWKVQRQLVNTYFKVKEQEKPVLQAEPMELPIRRTSSTPVPRNPSFYIRNRRKINKLCDMANITLSVLYHHILMRVGEEYDLTAAEKIYETERGYKPVYPMDMIDYFPELSRLAEEFLDGLIKLESSKKR